MGEENSDVREDIVAWSFSRLMDYEACPYRFYLKHIAKAEQPELDKDHPMVRGRRIHEEVEHYISGETDDFPSSGKKCQVIIDECKARFEHGSATVEEKWGFEHDWAPCGWWDDTVWCRMATDYHERIDTDVEIIRDWKTGKSFGNEVKYMQQMQLYAVGAFMRNPHLRYLDVHLNFLDDGKERTKSFQRDSKIIKLTSRFTDRAMRLNNTIYKPNPSLLNCKYCPFGTEFGTGGCVYAAEKL